MRKFWPLIIAGLLLVGCDRSNPTSSSIVASEDQTAVAFSELSMVKTTVVGSPALMTAADVTVAAHDSLRNAAMLDSLRAYLVLSDEQFTSVQAYGAVLYASLLDIKSQVDGGTIGRKAAESLVIAARNTFISSVRSILTVEQSALLDAWLGGNWHKIPHRPGGGGRGHGVRDSLKVRDSLAVPDSLRGPGGFGHPDSLSGPHGPGGLGHHGRH